MGINRGGNVYLFQKNVLGDVTHIYDTEGNLKARYIYDAWGNHKIVDMDEADPIGEINPIRYRSYYYDVETGLYYLRARYYDPETGRFISQDDTQFIDSQHLMGLHLYAYCHNNPVEGIDPTGCALFSKRKFYEKVQEARQFFTNVGIGLKNDVQRLWDSVYVDVGVGSGAGASVEYGGISATGMFRFDAITLRKDVGSGFCIGYAEESYMDLCGAFSSFATGSKKFYGLDGTPQYHKILTPDFDFTIEFGTSQYYFFGGTAKIGFDWGYYLNKQFFEN